MRAGPRGVPQVHAVQDLSARAGARRRGAGGDEGVMVRLATNVTDPVADLLTRIRNANLAAKDELAVPGSRMNEAICGILEHEGYIRSVRKDTEDAFPVLKVELKYGRGRQRT